MRCRACDVILDDLETLKKDHRGVHYDLCTDCLTVSIAANWELENTESIDNTGIFHKIKSCNYKRTMIKYT